VTTGNTQPQLGLIDVFIFRISNPDFERRHEFRQ